MQLTTSNVNFTVLPDPCSTFLVACVYRYQSVRYQGLQSVFCVYFGPIVVVSNQTSNELHLAGNVVGINVSQVVSRGRTSWKVTWMNCFFSTLLQITNVRQIDTPQHKPKLVLFANLVNFFNSVTPELKQLWSHVPLCLWCRKALKTQKILVVSLVRNYYYQSPDLRSRNFCLGKISLFLFSHPL